MNEYSDFRATMAHFDFLTEPKLILAVICSLVSKLVSNDTIAKATEEVMRAYNELNTKKSITEITSNDTPLFATKVLTDSSLSPIDKGVYSVLCTLADSETLQCSPKVATIARKASCSESSVRKSLATLEKHKVIRRKFRYINHRQIPSLYTVLASQTEACEQNTETQNNAPIVENNNTVEMVSNSTVQADTYFLGDTKNRARPLHEESYALHEEEGEKTLRVFKDSLREEVVNLPASAEKIITPEKDSLTGGALLPSLTDKNKEPNEDPRNETSTSKNSEKTPLIKAECNGTNTADNTSNSELPEALLREYDQLRSEYTRNEKPTEEPKSVASRVKGVLANIMKKRIIKTDDCGLPTVSENLSVEAYEPPVIKTEAMNATENPAEIPATDVARADIVPADKSSELQTEGDAPMVSADPAIAEHVPAPKTACDTPATSSETQAAMSESVSTPKDTGKKSVSKFGKGKRTVSRHPKERYSPEDAPEIMRSTAEYFLYKTGRVALRWEEIAVLRKFSATQYPAMVQKEIVRACERFKKRKESLKCLTLMYIEVALRDRPTFGSKAKAKKEVKKAETQSSSTVKEKTEEEKAAEEAQAAADMARMEELQAQMNERIRIDHEERCKRLFGIKRICRVGVEEANAGVEVSSREESRSE